MKSEAYCRPKTTGRNLINAVQVQTTCLVQKMVNHGTIIKEPKNCLLLEKKGLISHGHLSMEFESGQELVLAQLLHPTPFKSCSSEHAVNKLFNLNYNEFIFLKPHFRAIFS